MQTEKIDPRRFETCIKLMMAIPLDGSWIRWNELRRKTKDEIKSPNALSNALKFLIEYSVLS